MPKNIAIFHQFLDNIGGAEIVTLTLARELGAHIYTTNINSDKIRALGFEDVLPHIHSIGHIPLKAPWRHQMALWRFARLHLGDTYDHYIISGDWAVSGAKHNKPNLWYVHSPCRELWDLRQYVRNEIISVKWQRPIFDVWSWFNRHLHAHYIQHVYTLLCNSENVKRRINTYLHREAAVVYPPTDTQSFYYKEPKDYWLSVNRLLKPKRIEMQLETFKKLPNEKLIIVGSYEEGAQQFEDYKQHLESIRPDNVEMRFWVPDTELKELYAECKGFITTAKDEDFGMTAIEAMASGKPVIAPNEGGYKESVVHNSTGVLIDDITPSKLAETIQTLDTKRHKQACQKRAREFDTNIFISNIQKEMCNNSHSHE